MRLFWERVLAAGSDPVEAVEKLAVDLGVLDRAPRSGPKVLTSAASKLMWFAGRDDVCIYDTRAVDALREASGWADHISVSYGDFFSSWHKAFDRYRDRIQAATKEFEVKNVYEWSAVPEKSESYGRILSVPHPMPQVSMHTL